MKKTLSIILIAAMLLSLIPLVVVAAPAGTAITSADELKAMSGNTSDSYYLANDITISGSWNFTTAFGSDLDGNGHTIYFADGVSITGGLFNRIKGDATIKNLNIVQLGAATYTPVNEGLGVVAAQAQGEGEWIKLSNVSVYANITVSQNVGVGGMLGDVRYCKVDMNRCVFDGSIRNTASGDRGGNISVVHTEFNLHVTNAVFIFVIVHTIHAEQSTCVLSGCNICVVDTLSEVELVNGLPCTTYHTRCTTVA